MANNYVLLLGLCVSVMYYATDNCMEDKHYATDSLYALCLVKNTPTKQEDSLYYTLPSQAFKGGSLLGIFDGHDKGAHIANFISRGLPIKFAHYLKDLSEKEAYEKAFFDCEEYILSNYSRGGSTALVVYLNCMDNKMIAHIANVGDSRVIFGSDSKVYFATQDHSLQREDERDRVLAQNGTVYRYVNSTGDECGVWRINGLAMTRSLGDKVPKGKMSNELTLLEKKFYGNDNPFYLQVWPGAVCSENFTCSLQEGQVSAAPEYTCYELDEDCQWLVAASDGLWEKVSNEDVVSIVDNWYKEKKALSGITEKLTEYAIKKGSKDNISIIVVNLFDLYKQYFSH